MEEQKSEIRKEGYLQERHHFFHLKDTAGQERDYHFHEFDKIVILLSGNVRYAVENELYSLRPGDILLIRHHTIHKALIDRSVPYERIIFYLDETAYSSILPEARLTECFELADRNGKQLLSVPEERRDRLLEILKNYETFSGCSGEQEHFMRETYLLQLLILLSGEAGGSTGGGTSRRGGKIGETLSYINANLTADLTVEALASRLFLSRSHFIRLFTEAVGSSVHSYVLQRRLLNASRLIREGTGAAEAAEQSGFDDYSSFYRAFRKEFGISPGELKR